MNFLAVFLAAFLAAHTTLANVAFVPWEDAIAIYSLSAEEQKCWSEINAHRVRHGRKPLQLDMSLTQASRSWSATMARSGFRHGSGQENIYAGSTSGQRAADRWKKSPGHNAFLLSTRITHAGIGASGTHWTFRGR